MDAGDGQEQVLRKRRGQGYRQVQGVGESSSSSRRRRRKRRRTKRRSRINTGALSQHNTTHRTACRGAFVFIYIPTKAVNAVSPKAVLPTVSRALPVSTVTVLRDAHP